jgi:hypothetical protein
MKQTKVVNCGKKVFVYDFDSTKHIKDFDFEKGKRGIITRMKRLLLTNFCNSNLPTSFVLKISEYTTREDLQCKINNFIEYLQRTSGNSEIRYYGVVKPDHSSVENSYLHLATNIEYIDILIDISEEDAIDRLSRNCMEK